MGFRLNRTYVLEFEGAMAGAEIRIRSTSIATMLRLREVTDLDELAGMLAEHVVDWNFEDENGGPLPATKEAILANLEGVELGRIGAEWYKAAAGITAPLEDPASVEAELSMEMMN